MKNMNRSLGQLRPATKTKPRSPDYTGRIRIRFDTLATLQQHHRERGGIDVVANIAGWHYDGDYITIELSPLYLSRQSFGHVGRYSDGPSDTEIANSADDSFEERVTLDVLFR
jgi:hypothetical protein